MTPQDALISTLSELGAVSGSVHRVEDGCLQLIAEYGLPENLLQYIQTIPRGKGMAGLAWLRKSPVSTCDLTTDDSGQVRERARRVNARAAIAIPVSDEQGRIELVVGFAYEQAEPINGSRLEECERAAETLGRIAGRHQPDELGAEL